MTASGVVTRGTGDRLVGRQEMGRLYPMATAVVGLWVAVAAISVFAPDLISGTEQEHVPIAAITTWFWGTVATGFVLFATAFPTHDQTVRWGLTIVVLGIWGAVAAASIFAPSIVTGTGTDSETIPIASLIGPVAGAIATGFACLAAAWSAVSERRS
jgi:hypothetical protein